MQTALPRDWHAAPPMPSPVPSARPRRSIGQILLDPRTIQWLLGSGGVLLVVGMVVWLASVGVFDNPHVVAASLGAGTVLMLAAGWWVIRATPLQLAGRAVTLLACLVMPLNLWFYHANSMLTLDGNLWMAAVVCCGLYAASALFLRDPLFVHVLVYGLAGTGLLILADMNKFAEIAAPSTLLAVMGLLAIHAERAFPVIDSPFSRNRFGRSFFRAGHVTLACSLLLLAGAQITGWIIAPTFRVQVPEIVTERPLQWLAIGIALAGAYAYLYSGIFAKHRGFAVPAVLTLLWSELLGLQLIHLRHAPETIISAIALTGLAMLTAGRFIESIRRTGKIAGSGLLLLSFACSTAMVLSRLIVERHSWANAILLAVMTGVSLVAALVSGRSNWRHGYLLMSLVNAALGALVLGALSHLTGWQKFEIVTVAVGLLSLVSGHVGWFREQNSPQSGVTRNLLVGALLAGVPLLIAAVVHRFGGEVSLPDELGLITVAALMLVSGIVLELRSTTIVGGSLFGLHLAILLACASWNAQLTLGAYLAIAGATVFLLGLGLAIYRERLISLPERIQRREGVFRVLGWR